MVQEQPQRSAAAIGGCELGPDVEQIGLRRALWGGIGGLVLGPNKLARGRVASCVISCEQSCELRDSEL